MAAITSVASSSSAIGGVIGVRRVCRYGEHVEAATAPSRGTKYGS